MNHCAVSYFLVCSCDYSFYERQRVRLTCKTISQKYDISINTISYQIKKGGKAMSKILSPQNREIVKKLCLENKLTIPSNETFPFHSQKNPAAGRSF